MNKARKIVVDGGIDTVSLGILLYYQLVFRIKCIEFFFLNCITNGTGTNDVIDRCLELGKITDKEMSSNQKIIDLSKELIASVDARDGLLM